MTKLLTLVSIAIGLSSASAQASCVDSLPLALKYGVSYLNLIENGGIALTAPVHNKVTADELCSQLTSADIQLLSKQGDYAAIMGFADKKCVVTMRINSDGKFSNAVYRGCQAN